MTAREADRNLRPNGRALQDTPGSRGGVPHASPGAPRAMTTRSPPRPPRRRTYLVRRCVAAAPGLAELAAFDAFLESVAETHRSPVLASERVADLAARQLALVIEQVLDQGQPAAEPPTALGGT